MDVCACLRADACMCADIHGDQKRTCNTMELYLQMLVSLLTWVLGTELKYPAGSTNVNVMVFLICFKLDFLSDFFLIFK